MNTQRIAISKLTLNQGQIDGLPANPRQWTREDIDKIAASLKETPELFEMRPCIVTPHKDQFVILAGSLRFCGARQNGDADVPCIVFEGDAEKMKEIVIKDNGSWGAWDYDALANEWDAVKLTEWGVPAWIFAGVGDDSEEFAGGKDHEGKETARLSDMEYAPVYYEPKETPTLKLEDCIDLDKYNAKVKAIDELNLTEEQKKVLRLFAFRFIKIDFEAVANYYSFNATESEKDAIERLRLVLVDGGGEDGLQGYIQDDMMKIADLSRLSALENGEVYDE